MVEQQVDEKILAGHFQWHLPADIGKPGTEFEQEAGDMSRQGMFKIKLVRLVTDTEKVEKIGILGGLLHHFRQGCRQGALKVADRLALAFVQSGFDLHTKCGA